MKHRLIKILPASAGRSKWILDAVCLLLCLMMLVPIAGCFANNSKPDAVIKADETSETADNGFYVKNLDFCEVSDKETCRLLSIDLAYNTIAIRVFIYRLPRSETTSREIVLLYNLEGKLQSQIDVYDAIGTDKVIVDSAIDTAGNLAIFARMQDDDKVVHHYLYSFDSEGELAGDPIELTFEEAILPISFIIGADGKMYFSEKYSVSRKTSPIYVFDSKGNMVFVTSKTNVTGILYQMDDMIYTVSKSGGAYSSEGVMLLPIDTESQNFGDSIDISKVTSSGGIPYAGSDGFYQLNLEGVYAINLDSEDTREVILWKDTDLDLSSQMYDVFPAAVVSSDKIFLFSSTKTGVEGATAVTVSLLTRE